jgi:cytochrome c-type biogenesis protein CcsB
MKFKTVLTLFFIALNFGSNSYSFDFCKIKIIEQHTILQNGRLKPLKVHATETLKYLTGKTKFDGSNAVETYCKLSFSNFYPPKKTLIYPLIEHITLKEKLKILPTDSFSFEDLEENRSTLMLLKKDTIEGSSLDKSINKALNFIRIYRDITSGNNWVVPTSDLIGLEGMEPISNIFSVTPKGSYARASEILISELGQRQKSFNNKFPNKAEFEYFYTNIKLPLLSMLLTLLAIAFLVARRSLTVGLIFTALTITAQTLLLGFRIYISERAPITNMYETVLFSGYAGLLMAVIIGHLKKEKMFLLIGLGYNLLSIFMLNFSGGMLSASIGPLVPVLRDNFWLSTHVTSIIASYGALALSWVMANIVLIKNRFSTISNKEINHYSDIIYSCLKYGISLLAGGIILGGVWADYSWGRFWGWDPKETWSLIVLCIYMIILHGRYTNWITNKRFVPFTAVAFLSVMMAWFGVNYILASGLHSYGFSEGGAIFLGIFFSAQLIILAITTPKLLKA